MKYLFQLLCSLAIVCTQCPLIYAQTIENFELATPGATSFTSNAKTFNLSTTAINFFVADFATLGYAGSRRFIHLGDRYGSVSTISVSSGSFKVNDFWFYVSGDAATNPGAPNPSTGPGSVTFTGKFRGATQFSFIKTTADLLPLTRYREMALPISILLLKPPTTTPMYP